MILSLIHFENTKAKYSCIVTYILHHQGLVEGQHEQHIHKECLRKTHQCFYYTEAFQQKVLGPCSADCLQLLKMCFLYHS